MVNATASSRSTPGGHFIVLDSLRGLCALLVFAFHARLNGFLPRSIFLQGSWMFVDFFFVLSGFVIAANYRQPLIDYLPVRRFLWLRLGRIYPLHLFLLLVLLAIECLSLIPSVRALMARPPFDTAHSAQAFVSNLLLLQSFGLHGQLTWNAPAWSIATEFWCYVLFAFAVAAVGKRIERWMVVTVLVCPLILYAATPYGINVTYDWGIVRSIYGFALGVLCWAAWQRIGTRLRGGALVWTLAEMGLVAGIVSFVIGAAGSRANLLGPVLFAAAVLMFAHAGGAVSRFLGLRPWLFIGALSYSIYMVHTLVLSLMVAVVKVFDHMTGMPHALSGHGNVLGNSALQQGLWFAVMFEIVIGVSWLTWTFVERPVQRWSRRIAPSIG